MSKIEAMLSFDLSKAVQQIDEQQQVLLQLCRKHGMPDDTNLCLQWLDQRLTELRKDT